MSEVEELLARTRVELRRESDEWQRARAALERVAGNLGEAPGVAPELDTAPSLETAANLSQARLTADSAELGPGNRLAGLKRLLMRVVRFYTDRQAAFNHSALRVLEGHAAQLGRIARGTRTALRAGEAGRAALVEEVARLRAQGESDQASLRALEARLGEQAERLVGGEARADAQHARLDDAVRELGDHEARMDRSDEDLARVESALFEVRARGEASAQAVADEGARRRGLHPPRLGSVYGRLESELRGPVDEIRARVEVYVPRIVAGLAPLESKHPFLDLGCGRGELVAALRDAGVPAEGVEASAALASECAEAGLPVVCGDLFATLESRSPESLAGVSAIQVVEHLDPEALLDLLDLVRSRLVPSGLLLLETIDVRTLYALRWFFADPTHRLPLVPATLSVFVEESGFEDVEILPMHPVEEPVAAPAGGSLRVDRIGSVVFGPQDFGLLARRGAG